MEDGPPTFRQGFTCPALLCVTNVSGDFAYGAVTPCGRPFQSRSAITADDTMTGLLRVRSPLLTESRLISLPLVTEMFQFTRFASGAYEFSAEYRLRGGLPHSDIPGSKPVSRLPEAFRRLPRPSSPVVAKASTECACSLDHITPNSRGYHGRANASLFAVPLSFALRNTVHFPITNLLKN